jgi:hypothetical protein
MFQAYRHVATRSGFMLENLRMQINMSLAYVYVYVS